jgi:hypothetical protein
MPSLRGHLDHPNPHLRRTDDRAAGDGRGKLHPTGLQQRDLVDRDQRHDRAADYQQERRKEEQSVLQERK